MENKIIKKDIKSGILEVEGLEDFVQKQLNETFDEILRRLLKI